MRSALDIRDPLIIISIEQHKINLQISSTVLQVVERNSKSIVLFFFRQWGIFCSSDSLTLWPIFELTLKLSSFSCLLCLLSALLIPSLLYLRIFDALATVRLIRDSNQHPSQFILNWMTVMTTALPLTSFELFNCTIILKFYSTPNWDCTSALPFMWTSISLFLTPISHAKTI